MEGWEGGGEENPKSANDEREQATGREMGKNSIQLNKSPHAARVYTYGRAGQPPFVRVRGVCIVCFRIYSVFSFIFFIGTCRKKTLSIHRR